MWGCLGYLEQSKEYSQGNNSNYISVFRYNHFKGGRQKWPLPRGGGRGRGGGGGGGDGVGRVAAGVRARARARLRLALWARRWTVTKTSSCWYGHEECWVSLLLASDATRQVAFTIDRSEWEAGSIAGQIWSWCCSRMAIEARARASASAGGDGEGGVRLRGPVATAADAVSGVSVLVEALLPVRGGSDTCGAVPVQRAPSSVRGVGGSGCGSCVGKALPMMGLESGLTGVNVVQTTSPLGRDEGMGES